MKALEVAVWEVRFFDMLLASSSIVKMTTNGESWAVRIGR